MVSLFERGTKLMKVDGIVGHTNKSHIKNSLKSNNCLLLHGSTQSKKKQATSYKL